MERPPFAYFISFRTYGTWLHGDLRGSVDRRNNLPHTPLLAPDDRRERAERSRLISPEVVLSAEQRARVDQTIREVCVHRGWPLHALSVRTNHVHAVVSSARDPEQVMNALKSWATRRLVEAGLLPPGAKAWARHGSTRYIWKPEGLPAAVRYVVEGQDRPFPGEEDDGIKDLDAL